MNKVEKLEQLIKEACKPLQGMPVALSGGLDSGVLAHFIKPKYAIHIESEETKYAKMVIEKLNFRLHIFKVDTSKFEEDMKKAVKIIGEPTPHFNIHSLYVMFRDLERLGARDLVLADGPDESMCGYTRHLIMNYLYNVWKYEAFEPYGSTISKLLPLDPAETYCKLVGVENKIKGKFSNLLDFMCRVDMEHKRPEMNIMSDKFAKHFGIKTHRPFETKKVDEFMFNLPTELKVYNVVFGKYALRAIADEYLPEEIAWRAGKMGGPLYSPNKMMGWDKIDGKYGKSEYLKFQERILND